MKHEDTNADTNPTDAAEVATDEDVEQQRDQQMVDALRSLGASGSGARIYRKVPSPDAP
jgi:hypothetical protein